MSNFTQEILLSLPLGLVRAHPKADITAVGKDPAAKGTEVIAIPFEVQLLNLFS